MKYTAVTLAARPAESITPDCFETQTRETPELEDGQILLRQTHMSLDPAMRGWMNEDKGSYIPPVAIGEVMRSSGVGEVIESKNPAVPVGTRLAGMIGWTELAVSDGSGLTPVPDGISAEDVLGALSLPGVTAWLGLFRYGDPKAGETLLVSGAAGSVGSLVGQMAKAEGLRAIGVAGGPEKCAWLTEELGFDAAIDYKSDDVNAAVRAAAPDGIDIYFENTGGPIQHAAYWHMNAFGRIVVCGMIADYNTKSPSPGPNWLQIVRKRLRIQGFTVPDHYDEYGEISGKVAQYLLAGKLKYRLHVLEGLTSAIEGINLLFTGGNRGKLIVKL